MLRRIAFAAVGIVTVAASVAVAANVHFVGSPTVTVNDYSPGGNPAPGQNKVPIRSVGAVSIPKREIKNGSVVFSVTTAELREITGTEAGCPNDNWTTEITDV